MDKEKLPTTDITETVQNEQTQNHLTERQKEILRSNNLPEVFNQLTDRQKRSIVDIEEMLQAVEAKYGKTFIYVNYNAEQYQESGVLTAYPEDGIRDLDMFSVYREDNGQIGDDYLNVASRQCYIDLVKEYVADVAGEQNIWVYADVFQNTLSEYPVKAADIPGNVAAESWIFVDGGAVSEADFQALTKSVSKWMQENNIQGTANLVLLKADTLRLLTRFNYTDYLLSQYYIVRETCSVNG